jgi:hypothetical protein
VDAPDAAKRELAGSLQRRDLRLSAGLELTH